MKRTTLGFTAPFFAVLLGATISAQAVLFDNFDSYTNNQVLAIATSNTVVGSPWGRFGAATSVNPTALTNQGVAASVAARYTLGFGLGNNASMVFWFPTPTDLTSTPMISLELRMSNTVATVSNTFVKVGFEEPDGTIWQTKTNAMAILTNAVFQTFTFNLASSDMERSAGTGAFDITTIKDLRIRFENAGGAGSQQIFLDNYQAIPEPSTLGLVGLGMGICAWVVRRRRS